MDISRQKLSVSLAPDAIPPGITPAQAMALGALMSGKPKTTAAREAGVSRQTIHAWLAEDPVFIAAYTSLRRELVDAIGSNLQLVAVKATATLRRLLTSRSVADPVKLGAAVAVLKLVKPVEGPTEPELVRDEIFKDRSGRKLKTLQARLGVRDDPEFEGRVESRVAEGARAARAELDGSGAALLAIEGGEE